MIHWFDENFCMIHNYLLTILISFSIFGCGSSISDDGTGQSIQENTVNLKNDTSNKGFKLYVPDYMKRIEDLHDEADAQFVYVEEENTNSGSESDMSEHFLIVLSEKKSDINNYSIPVKPTLESYHRDAIEAMRMNEDVLKLNVLDSIATIQGINGCQVIVSDITTLINTDEEPIELFYKIAIIEGKKAFYQVITWCPLTQKPKFFEEMNKISQSFKEI